MYDFHSSYNYGWTRLTLIYRDLLLMNLNLCLIGRRSFFRSSLLIWTFFCYSNIVGLMLEKEKMLTLKNAQDRNFGSKPSSILDLYVAYWFIFEAVSSRNPFWQKMISIFDAQSIKFPTQFKFHPNMLSFVVLFSLVNISKSENTMNTLLSMGKLSINKVELFLIQREDQKERSGYL